MSQTIRDALRPSIDQKTADFIDASIAVQNAERVRDETSLTDSSVCKTSYPQSRTRLLKSTPLWQRSRTTNMPSRRQS